MADRFDDYGRARAYIGALKMQDGRPMYVVGLPAQVRQRLADGESTVEFNLEPLGGHGKLVIFGGKDFDACATVFDGAAGKALDTEGIGQPEDTPPGKEHGS